MGPHAGVRDDLPAYALDALDADDRARVEEHLRTCASCTDELAGYRVVVGVLPYALPHRAPPPAARVALLERARREPSGRDGSDRGRPGQEARRLEPLALPASDTARTRPDVPRRRAGSVLAGWRAAAAALALLLAAAVAFGAWQAGAPHASLGTEIAARLPGGRVLSLAGTGTPGASARLYVGEAGRSAELAIEGLRPLPADRVYQLWFARPGQPTVTGGTFRVDAAGQAVTPVTIPAPLADVTAVAVTEEPAPGSPAPTGAHLLDWTP